MKKNRFLKVFLCSFCACLVCAFSICFVAGQYKHTTFAKAENITSQNYSFKPIDVNMTYNTQMSRFEPRACVFIPQINISYTNSQYSITCTAFTTYSNSLGYFSISPRGIYNPFATEYLAYTTENMTNRFYLYCTSSTYGFDTFVNTANDFVLYTITVDYVKINNQLANRLNTLGMPTTNFSWSNSSPYMITYEYLFKSITTDAVFTVTLGIFSYYNSSTTVGALSPYVYYMEGQQSEVPPSVAYQQGYEKAQKESYDSYYNQGVSDTKANDYQGKTYNQIFNEGSNYAYNQQNTYTFERLLYAVLESPFKAFKTMFNFEILGINLTNLFTSLITIACVIFVVSIFI